MYMYMSVVAPRRVGIRSVYWVLDCHSHRSGWRRLSKRRRIHNQALQSDSVWRWPTVADVATRLPSLPKNGERGAPALPATARPCGSLNDFRQDVDEASKSVRCRDRSSARMGSRIVVRHSYATDTGGDAARSSPLWSAQVAI
jgi:hypothetical protein